MQGCFCRRSLAELGGSHVSDIKGELEKDFKESLRRSSKVAASFSSPLEALESIPGGFAMGRLLSSKHANKVGQLHFPMLCHVASLESGFAA